MNPVQPFSDAPPNAIPVRGFLHTPATPTANALVLTHGAGANAEAPLLVALAAAFCAAGWTVLRCDLPFRQLRPHGPPHPGSADRDQQGLKAAVASLERLTSARVYLGGHSYGGRQSSMLAAAEPGLVPALLLLSYPLHPPRKLEQLRTTHFPNLRTPALFVHGTRDPFATLDELTAALRLIPARTELLPIPSAGHELATPRNRDQVAATLAQVFLAFTAT